MLGKWGKVTHGRVEDEFRPFEEVQIPNSHDPVWIVWRRQVLVVGRHRKFRELSVQMSTRSMTTLHLTPTRDGTAHFGRPVEVGHRPVFGPSIVRECTKQLDLLTLCVVTVTN